MAHLVKVIGVGPGHPDYLLPIARKQAALCTALAGSARALALFAAAGRPTLIIDGRLERAVKFLEEQLPLGPVGVLVSGDPGFYSLLGYLQKELPAAKFEVFPGVSSLQLAFARLGLPWQEAALGSFHGRKPQNLASILKERRPLGLLLDPSTDLGGLAATLAEYGDWLIYLCRNLSYEDETIIKITTGLLAQEPPLNNTVAVIIPHDHGN